MSTHVLGNFFITRVGKRDQIVIKNIAYLTGNQLSEEGGGGVTWG